MLLVLSPSWGSNPECSAEEGVKTEQLYALWLTRGVGTPGIMITGDRWKWAGQELKEQKVADDKEEQGKKQTTDTPLPFCCFLLQRSLQRVKNNKKAKGKRKNPNAKNNQRGTDLDRFWVLLQRFCWNTFSTFARFVRISSYGYTATLAGVFTGKHSEFIIL